MKTKTSESRRASSPVANLVRYVPSGFYFARARVSGKLIRRSRKPKTSGIGQFGSTNFEIYVLLMVYHPFIEQLGSGIDQEIDVVGQVVGDFPNDVAAKKM